MSVTANLQLDLSRCCGRPLKRYERDDTPRCTGCGHRTQDPVSGRVPVETRYRGPRAWFAELPARARARAAGRGL